ncbi:hypothetical protein KFE25_011034 [Diacronema lutheri]|uniref:Carbohydrate-binding domain-containing protein n=2 Tax=Diacronema lutheri TaxID=2081491 RepID=A0A8J5XJV8_DIALT|nr:hypothetical protein KFE25_011034 [Diacronema lutheri]
MLSGLAVLAAHTPPEPRSYTAARLRGALGPLDGDLTKPAWAQAAWSSDFEDIRGTPDAPADAQPPAGCRTRFKMLWDDNFLYVGALLEYDGPLYQIEASFTERNAPIYQRDSDIEVFVDADATCHWYEELELNALNTPWNLLLDRPYMDGGSEHSGRVAAPGEPLYWDARAQRTAVKLVRGRAADARAPAAWSAEIALAHNDTLGARGAQPSAMPSAARLAPRVGDVWRINLSRVERRGAINWVWSAQRAWAPAEARWAGVVDMHRPEAWGALHFADEAGRLPEPRTGVPDWPLRAAGAMLYYAQRAFRDGPGGGRYAHSVEELVAARLVPVHLLRELDARLSPAPVGGYVARVCARGAPAGARCLTVRDDRLMQAGAPPEMA